MKIAKLLPYVVVLLAAVLLAACEGDLLYRLQEQNLFLHSTLFFEQRMVVAGGLLTWAGAYLTQYFYYPMLGAGLLCLLWLFLVWLLGHTFGLAGGGGVAATPQQAKRQAAGSATALIPIACLLLTIVDLGYWVYYLKLPGHPFVATIGTIVSVALAWSYRKLCALSQTQRITCAAAAQQPSQQPSRHVSRPFRSLLPLVFVLLTACVGYPLFGFYGLLALVLMAILSWCADETPTRPAAWKVADSLVAVLAVCAVPLLCYHTLYHETNIVNIYWTALPVFAMHGERYAAYNLPYAVLVVSLVAMALSQTVGRKAGLRTSMRTTPTEGATSRTFGLAGVISLLLILATVVCVACFWYKDTNFHHELTMQRAIEQQDWQRVLTKAKTVKGEPTRAMCLMQNLALFRLGRMEKEMFNYPNGAARPRAPFPVRLVHTVGKELYLQYGIPNYCYRWCMEDGVEYGWTVERLKLMAKCSLLNGEFTAAQRFINMLKKTDFQRSWALRYEACVQSPQRVAQDPELNRIIPLLRADNFLTADQSQLEMFLVEHILSTPGGTSAQQELARLTMYYYKNNRYRLVEP